MKSTKNRFFLLFATLFLALTLACWFHSPRAESLTERRKLAQKPELTLKSFTGGSFASSFESYSQDQFPLREGFRTLKALFQTKVLGRQDNNNIYVRDGWLAQLEYPENLSSADYAASRFQQVYDRYLSGSSRVYLSVIPDKGYFLEGIPNLTKTERRIFDGYVAGLRSREIVEQLDIKDSTLRFHNKNIYEKLGVSSLKQLQQFAAILNSGSGSAPDSAPDESELHPIC